jgi:hypothetical protein
LEMAKWVLSLGGINVHAENEEAWPFRNCEMVVVPGRCERTCQR